tara:strand:+ start:247 stop:492 length:246 start_codon:yes stop_codon:yes gene_type:complete
MKPSLSTTGARRFGTFVVAAAALVLLGWSSLAPLDSAAIAPGIIAVESDRSTIQHVDGGIVRQLHVKSDLRHCFGLDRRLA